MAFLRLTVLLPLLMYVAVVSTQEYYVEEYDFEPNVRTKRDVEDFIMQRNNENLQQKFRIRRDDDISRNKRQGGHGNGNGGGHEGITGPVHTFVKTDEHAHFKWGVRHHVGHEYAGRR